MLVNFPAVASMVFVISYNGRCYLLTLIIFRRLKASATSMDELMNSSDSPLNHDNVGRVGVISRCLLMNGLRNALKISVVNFHCVC